jgi:GcrA cell cycle regulator
MLWTAEAIEDLKRLALEGKSASHIAGALGVGSRNAVIGKASRMGVKLSGGGRANAPGKTRAGARRAQWAAFPRPQLASSKQSFAALASEVRSGEDSNGLWAFGQAEIGEMRRVRFEDIREFACRWPLGDPRSGEFAYCGLTPAKNQSYCAGHCRMAHRPPQARQSARERQGFRAIASSWRPS